MKGFILYKIFYGDKIVYLGRTKQDLQTRIRGHLFAKPMHRKLNIDLITKIEYAEFKTEADMFVYEVFFINKYKPPLNVDDKACDTLTIELQDVNWKLFKTKLWNKWIDQVDIKIRIDANKQSEKIKKSETLRKMRKFYHDGIISEETYYEYKESLKGTQCTN